MMKKLLIPFLLICLVFASACGAPSQDSEKSAEGGETRTYQSEKGAVEVPAEPKRVVALHPYAGHVLSLGIKPVAVDQWTKMNPRWEKQLKDVPVVSDENLEKIIELNPDLIIGISSMKNQDKLNEIAPTVTYTYGKLDYLEQFIEIGKLLNKEEEAVKWVEDFKKRAKETGEKIKAKIGEDATVSVIESFEKQIYVYGENWGRGTEVLYQAMGLKMPEKVKEKALKPGYYAISPEMLPEFAGDYLIVSKFEDTDNSYMETKTYKNLPAVKKGRAFVADAKAFQFNDPDTLDYQLEFFKEKFLGQ
ncbi:iron complex transport system substrate-binding protein [Planifilum fimeticola]|jgi:iron complex transport system substrate-binding protein|uniref:Iron complex transport system substrate-binding protein n=2 Tax=Planifilum fimeticola TaxID=201975 RepID=A0A2T0LBD9_9BACL|nr:iron complex transport system substrate-binding protein [Planifilum fimeticola]